MKRTILFISIGLGLLFTSCDKYLETLPDQRTQLNTPAKVSELLVTAYPRKNYFVFAEAMTDNPIDNSISGVIDNKNGDAYFWKDVQETSQDSPIDYWNSCYAAIAAANQALQACDAATDPSQYSSQKGEALMARAYAHFMLVTLYSKAYKIGGDNSSPGIPYVTEPENVVIKQYDRKTVDYVYAQIEKDIVEGLPLIRDNYTVPAYHFTKKAANAFATRFYLFKGDNDKVIEHADLVYPNAIIGQNLRPWLSYANYTTDELRAAFTNANNPGNLLIAETVSSLARNYYRYRYSLSQNKLNQITAPLSISLTAYKKYSTSSTFYFVMKFVEHFVRVNVNATTGTPYTMVPLLTTEEVLFNRAEANVRKENYPAVLADLNTFLSQRITGYTSNNALTEAKIKAYYGTSVDTKQAYLNTVLDIKRAEFVHEGMRWLDILRYDMPVTHFDAAGNTYLLPAGDNRRMLQLPDEVTLSGLTKNPR